RESIDNAPSRVGRLAGEGRMHVTTPALVVPARLHRPGLLVGVAVAALALFGSAHPAPAQPPSALPPPETVPPDSIVHAATLPPPAAGSPRVAAVTPVKPFLTPDPAGLAAAKRGAGASSVPTTGLVADGGPRVLIEGPRAPSVIRQFDGLANTDQATPFLPPDPNLSVGPTQVFEMVNVSGRIFTKTGFPVSTFSLNSFFGVTAGFRESDPHVIFDALSGRWFAVYLEFN